MCSALPNVKRRRLFYRKPLNSAERAEFEQRVFWGFGAAAVAGVLVLLSWAHGQDGQGGQGDGGRADARPVAQVSQEARVADAVRAARGARLVGDDGVTFAPCTDAFDARRGFTRAQLARLCGGALGEEEAQ